jgi:hypothetical protein
MPISVPGAKLTDKAGTHRGHPCPAGQFSDGSYLAHPQFATSFIFNDRRSPQGRADARATIGQPQARAPGLPIHAVPETPASPLARAR